MIEVKLTIIEEVNEQENGLKTKEKARQQFKNKLINAILIDLTIDDITRQHENIDRIINCMSWSIIKPPEPSWSDKVGTEAKNFIKDYLVDELIEALNGYSDVNKILQNYERCSNNFNEMIQDRSYGPEEALELIQELSAFEETDQGIIGNGPIDDQLSLKATYTYTNAMHHEIESILEDIESNINMDIDDIKLEIAKSMLTNDDRKKINVPETDDDDLIEYINETYGSDFEDKLTDALREHVLEELR